MHFRMTLRRLSLVVLLQLSGVLCTVTTVGDRTVLAGQSITVPCHYDAEYISNVKYWCQGSQKVFCTTLARTDKPDNGPFSKARITIADDPTQNVFTVTMNELKDNESGWYWCGVEIGGIWSVDNTKSLYISVKQGMSIEKNEITAEEGGSVTVHFLYSEKHRENEKKWCRSGQVQSCKVTNNGTFSSKFLLINDDRKDTVTVTMRQVGMRDAGYYYCGASEHQVPVHLLVNPRSTTTTLDATTQQNLSEVNVQDSSSHSIWQPLLIVCGALLILITAGLVTRIGIRENVGIMYNKPFIIVK